MTELKNHWSVWQKKLQYCKVSSLQIKQLINLKKKNHWSEDTAGVR